MLFGEDALGEGGFGVGGEDVYGALEDEDAAVYAFIDEVNAAAGDGGTVVEGLALGVEAGERRQQRRVDVEKPVGELADEVCRKQAHVAGEADEVDAEFFEQGEDSFFMLGLRPAAAFKGNGFDAEGASGFDAGSSGDVGEDDGDFAVGEAAVARGADDGHAVGAAAGDEDGDSGHRKLRVNEVLGSRF